MVDLDTRASAKLVDRGARLVQELTGLDREAALELLEHAGGHVKVAVVMAHRNLDPVSARALGEWERFVAHHPQAALAFVDVIGDRPVARGISEVSGIRHESPQAILFRDGKATWDASHGSITAESLASAWNGG